MHHNNEQNLYQYENHMDNIYMDNLNVYYYHNYFHYQNIVLHSYLISAIMKMLLNNYHFLNIIFKYYHWKNIHQHII